ncbi:entry exclusion lipoprotein TrbK [Paracoccus sp. N5]|uniref:entry exclusion lipoprotein TrbK n=1 Tax=Paracoccus sp. N5 TaxID=1101189 RepID=UPI000381F2A3|nr:entry exclusion lipoprotein TrbK [Paracoccus sp. N5]
MQKTLLIAALMAALLAGCEKQPPAPVMPEVNDANCQLPKIMEIKDKATREAFAGTCAHRSPTGGGIAPTKDPKNWLELIDQTTPKGQEVKP